MQQRAEAFRIRLTVNRIRAVLMLALLFWSPAAEGFAQEMIIAPAFDDVGHFHEGIAPALSEGKWGFVDRSGKWVVKPGFDEVQTGSGGRFGVRVGGVWGFLNTAGKVAVEPVYEAVKPFSSGMAAVRKNGKWGYIDPAGTMVEEPIYTFAGEVSNGFRFVNDDEFGFRILTGSGVPVEIYLEGGTDRVEAGAFADNGWAPVRSGGAWYFGSVRGDVTRTPFKNVRGFSEDLAAVSKDGKTWGFIDAEGKMIVPARYEGAREFMRGIAPVKVGGKWGFIDKEAKVVLSPRYDNAYPVRDGWAIFRIGDGRGFLKVSSATDIVEAVEPRFEDVFSPKEGLAPVKLDGKWGFMKLSEPGGVVREIVDLEGR